MYLERWAIDEVTEISATLLRSVYGKEIDIPKAGGVKAIVMGLERKLAADDWGEEDDFVLSRQELGGFIHDTIARSREPELPEARGLREGDVYWIVSEEPVSPPGGSIGPRRTKRFLAPYEQSNVKVWDVTAAARQAAKVAYFQAMQSAQEKRQRQRR